MKSKITIAVRVLLGIIFFGAGLTGLLNLVPTPPDLPENLQTFNRGLVASGYFMTLLKLTETTFGFLLIIGYFVPLALVVLAPIAINIFFVHLFLAPQGLVLATIIGLMMIYLSFFAEPYCLKIKALFRAK